MHSSNCSCQFAYALVVSANNNNRTNTIIKNFLKRHHFTRSVTATIQDDVESIIQHHFSAQLKMLNIYISVSRHSDLATVGQYVDSLIIIDSYNGSV